MNKSVLVVGSIVVVASLFYFGKRSGEELSLPECELTKVAETPVFFFIDDSIDEHRLQEYIDYSNLVLSNSCVPLKRTLAGVSNIDTDEFKGNEVGSLHQQLLKQMTPNDHEKLKQTDSYYVLVLPSSHEFTEDGTVGTAHVNFSRRFLVLSTDSDVHVLEHELGHLAWAWHNDTPDYWLKGGLLPEFHKHIRSYARGALCGDAGTVMTYAENQLPIYSSPDIKYYGKACGNENSANNARLMREFAASLLSTEANFKE